MISVPPKIEQTKENQGGKESLNSSFTSISSCTLFFEEEEDESITFGLLQYEGAERQSRRESVCQDSSSCFFRDENLSQIDKESLWVEESVLSLIEMLETCESENCSEVKENDTGNIIFNLLSALVLIGMALTLQSFYNAFLCFCLSIKCLKTIKKKEKKAKKELLKEKTKKIL